MRRTPAFTGANGSPDVSIAPSLCPSRSTPIRLRRSAGMAFWACFCRVPNRTSRSRSRSRFPKGRAKMANEHAMEVQQKREAQTQGEKTVPARFYMPPTDIYETEDALTVLME